MHFLIPQLVFGLTFSLLFFFRAGIMFFNHEVNSKECGPSLSSCHTETSQITRTLQGQYIITSGGFFFFKPLLFGPELENHCFSGAEISHRVRNVGGMVFIEART